ncbi:hypothetical protein CHU92_01885 [Flavobacterium cyanobacteriorum]|uniref:Uncharacterized protein n=1 Tax=Flavobacterium cyanobacteriorum TaxID=2022802 RepID=A0A255ZVU8_9FLAO|nr:hypothetical protein [Flavobacterium cyanobacteriorum]OYQ45603.1 hypothetical protein CHU92_01885 [Flavobacterium cyanobacteriorum]
MRTDHLDLLKAVKKVEIADTVFEKIKARLEQPKPAVIPLYRAGIAASMLLALLAAELVYTSHKMEKNEENIKLTAIARVNNNSLYQ